MAGAGPTTARMVTLAGTSRWSGRGPWPATGRRCLTARLTPGAGARRRRPHDRSDRRDRLSARIPGASSRSRRRLHRGSRRGAPADHVVVRGTGTPPHAGDGVGQTVGDPQWSPDGRRLAFTRDERSGSSKPTAPGSRGSSRSPGRSRPALVARWAAAGVSLAPARLDPGVAHRAPVPRRGRPQRAPGRPRLAPDPRRVDVGRWPGRPTVGGSRSWPSSSRPTSRPPQFSVVDVATGGERRGRGQGQPRHRGPGSRTGRSLRQRCRRLVPGHPPVARWP